MKKQTCVLILLAVLLLGGVGLLLKPKQGAVAEIRVDGVLVRTIDLSALTEPVELSAGEHNTLLAEPGRISMLCADCPDQLCVHMGWTDSPAKPIVCLPNGVTVTITGGSEESDAVLR